MNALWYLNKTNNIKKYQKTSYFTITCIILLWIYYRIFNNLYLIINSIKYYYKFTPIPIVYFVLNIYWFYEIIKMIYKKIK